MLKSIKVIGSSMLFASCTMISLQAYAATPVSAIEQQVRQAVKGTKFEVERRGDAVVVIVPVNGGFHAKREGVLLPASLRPISNISKIVKPNKDLALLVIGHTHNAGSDYVNKDISLKRANSVGSIFRVAGLTTTQLYLNGVGAAQPRADNKTKKGQELNKRVEIIVVNYETGKNMLSLSDQYAVTKYNAKGK